MKNPVKTNGDIVSKKVHRNESLNKAKRAKQDEFYTREEDIETEFDRYIEHNGDINLFKDKVILLPCDDPTWSAFTRFFVKNFHDLGLKKLISTCLGKNPAADSEKEQITLFEDELKTKEADKEFTPGKIFVLEKGGVNDNAEVFKSFAENNVGNCWQYLEGDGDFRSEEITNLKKEADFIVTNPPFSLFREFVDWVMQTDVKFAIMGTLSAITYKNVFPFLKGNTMWLGYNAPTLFSVPAGFEVNDTVKKVVEGVVYQKFGNICWYTNIDHARRHNFITLSTMEDNKLYNNRIINNKYAYERYDNYDAIEVPYTACIPSDYKEIMAVPVSFMDKYNPEQFEITGMGMAPIIGGKEFYKRVFIKHKK